MSVKITGNTFPVKDAIRGLGGKWNAAEKAWYVPDDRAAEAQALVAGAPVAAPATPGVCRDCGTTCKAPFTVCWPCKQKRDARFGGRKCSVCGAKESRDARGYPIVKIYRSGECQDCYEERKMGY